MNQASTEAHGYDEAERRRLVHFCRQWTGDTDAGEDIAQIALLEAWRGKHTLRNPAAYSSWLYGIARNQCRRWQRRQLGARGREVPLPDGAARGQAGALTDHFDVELELERGELAYLLDRALHLLTPPLRSVLVARFIEELPQREVAARMNLSESAVEARIHRGKRALRRVLETELRADATALGLIAPAAARWQETRIWCPLCGSRRLLGIKSGDALQLRCPDCTPINSSLTNGGPAALHAAVKAFKPALTRLIAHAADWVHQSGADGSAGCPQCGRRLPLQLGSASPLAGARASERFASVSIGCLACNTRIEQSLTGAALALPPVQRFWRDYPRLRALPEREMLCAGRPAYLLRFASVTQAAAIDIVLDRATLRAAAVHRVG